MSSTIDRRKRDDRLSKTTDPIDPTFHDRSSPTFDDTTGDETDKNSGVRLRPRRVQIKKYILKIIILKTDTNITAVMAVVAPLMKRWGPTHHPRRP